MTYKLGSLFDGSGGFPLAGSLCGIEPAWASEVEPYPIAVTRSRFPNMKHLGDISKINGAEVEPVDIITFGSPCQDLSVAGKRAGLKHEANGDEETTRSGLFMEAVRIIREMKEATHGRFPAYALWENVPGAFSSNGGEDFRIVLEELIKIVEPTAVMPAVPKNGWPYADSYCGDGWSLAYRVFDAQYWGVPQRRRRIHLVLDLRGERAREVLFEREGVRGYFAEGRTPWQAAASHAEDGTGADDREGAVPYTLKIRSGCEGGGKGALIQIDKSATLATNNDQYLFQPVPNILLDDQGGQQISVRTDGKSPTLRAETHGNLPCVMESAGFCPEQSAKTRGIGYEEETAPTLRAGVTPGVAYSIENHPADSRVSIDESGKVQTLTSRMGTGGGNVPMVMEPVVQLASGKEVAGCLMASGYEKLGAQEMFSGDYTVVEKQPVYCLQGNGIDRADTAGCNGKGWKEDVGYTLNTIDRPAVAYGVETFHCNTEEEKVPTLKARDWKDPNVVCYETPIAIDRAFFNQGQNAKYDPQYYTDGTNPTLVARGPSAVAVRYIVRRLTPTECARLQGFADRWGDIDPKTEFSDAEYRFWMEVRNTHATVIGGKEAKEYTKEQMLTWYNKLHTDSAEYKLWGNGIALPPALYCLQGITDVLNAYAGQTPDPSADIVMAEEEAETPSEEPVVEPICEEEPTHEEEPAPAPTIDPEKEKMRETLMSMAQMFGNMAQQILEVCK